MKIEFNEGERPSRLQLDRFLTGELSSAEAAEVAARIGEREELHLAAVKRARAEVPPFDARAIRARGGPRPANNTRWFGVFAAVAAVAATVLLGLRLSTPVPSAEVQFRGEGGLEVYALHGAELALYAGEALGQGDVLGFQVTPGEHSGVVVLSVDGTGAVSVFYPAAGDAPEPVAAGAAHAPLPDSVTLDGAPGPEIFVAVFDRPVSEARALVAARYQEGGARAVLEWADAEAAVDAVEVQRR